MKFTDHCPMLKVKRGADAQRLVPPISFLAQQVKIILYYENYSIKIVPGNLQTDTLTGFEGGAVSADTILPQSVALPPSALPVSV